MGHDVVEISHNLPILPLCSSLGPSRPPLLLLQHFHLSKITSGKEDRLYLSLIVQADRRLDEHKQLSTMEQLDEFLLSRHIDLEEDHQSVASGDSASNELRNKLTENLLRSDVMAPHLVQFTHTYNPYKKRRRVLILLIVLGLSIRALSHFSKTVATLSYETTLDIESKNITSKNTEWP